MEEWVALVEGGDERLRFLNVVQPFGSSMSVLEVVRDDLAESNGHTESVANGRINGRLEHKLDGKVNSEMSLVVALPEALAT